MSIDLNQAEDQQADLIPSGTLAKVRMTVRPGGFDEPSQGWTDGMATRNTDTGSVYLDCEFTVIGGPYDKRKLWSLIGLHSPKGVKWAGMGLSFMKAIINSAFGLRKDDQSPQATQKRVLPSLRHLDGMEFVARITTQQDDEYGPKNVIKQAVGPEHKDYAALMQPTAMGQPTPPAQPPKPHGWA